MDEIPESGKVQRHFPGGDPSLTTSETQAEYDVLKAFLLGIRIFRFVHKGEIPDFPGDEKQIWQQIRELADGTSMIEDSITETTKGITPGGGPARFFAGMHSEQIRKDRELAVRVLAAAKRNDPFLPG